LEFDVAANISGMALDAGQATKLNFYLMQMPNMPNMQFDVDVVASTCMQLSVQGVFQLLAVGSATVQPCCE
jgi:hypothetical protein